MQNGKDVNFLHLLEVALAAFRVEKNLSVTKQNVLSRIRYSLE